MQLPAIMEDKLGDVSDFMAAIERFTVASCHSRCHAEGRDSS